MSEGRENRPYDLEERTYVFARDVRRFVKLIERTIANVEDARQVIRSSGSVAANYIEANEALSKKDFQMRIKICRKEAKESRLWLRLIDTEARPEATTLKDRLQTESQELMNIFGAIFRKSEGGE
jgi:four helix bundle protein